MTLTIRRIGTLALATALAVLLIGQGRPAEPRAVEARSLVVRDADGTARFTVTSNGIATIYLHDPRGGKRIALHSSGNSSYVLLAGEQGDVRVSLGANTQGSHLVLSDATGVPRAALRTAVDGSPSLTLSDASGKERMTLHLRGGDPELVFLDAEGAVLCRLPLERPK